MTSNTSNTSHTQTLSVTQAPPVLTLRASQTGGAGPQAKEAQQSAEKERPGLRWEQGTVDNENMGKKKTKICCIFHPQDEDDDEFAEPEVHMHTGHSDEDNDDSDSDSSGESEDDNKGGNFSFDERRRRRIERRRKNLAKDEPLEPNAYEFQPDYSHRRAPNGLNV
ncbi:type 1 protein phosphatase-activating protein [Maudiozyma humilis]|uniref:Type 1 phosphatases regulator n=1 Tax=Maudiozyma humilis TaxID=51915 RepID=A0AAV5RVF7_MAUHU|nr:type 1 protein phosphatase-activating protein [Kazachstania humilis]